MGMSYIYILKNIKKEATEESVNSEKSEKEEVKESV